MALPVDTHRMGALTDTKIRNLKPRQRPYQVADGAGLVLEVRPSGQKAWLYRYRVYGRQEKLSLGSYPELSLADVRERHFEARRLVAAGKSPARVKQDEKRRLSDDLRTIRGLSKAYLDDHVAGLASSTRACGYVQNEILPAIGNKLTSEVTPSDCIAIVERIKRRGAPAVARKVLEQLRGLFGYAVDRSAHHQPCRAGPCREDSRRQGIPGPRLSSRGDQALSRGRERLPDFPGQQDRVPADTEPDMR